MIHLTLFGGTEAEIAPGGFTALTIFGGAELKRPTLAQRIMQRRRDRGPQPEVQRRAAGDRLEPRLGLLGLHHPEHQHRVALAADRSQQRAAQRHQNHTLRKKLRRAPASRQNAAASMAQPFGSITKHRGSARQRHTPPCCCCDREGRPPSRAHIGLKRATSAAAHETA